MSTHRDCRWFCGGVCRKHKEIIWHPDGQSCDHFNGGLSWNQPDLDLRYMQTNEYECIVKQSFSEISYNG